MALFSRRLGLMDYPPKYAESPLMNKPTVSFRGTTDYASAYIEVQSKLLAPLRLLVVHHYRTQPGEAHTLLKAEGN
jgi:hypothetical protein